MSFNGEYLGKPKSLTLRQEKANRKEYRMKTDRVIECEYVVSADSEAESFFAMLFRYIDMTRKEELSYGDTA